MADISTVEQHHVDQFATDAQLLAQQEESVLRGTTMEKPSHGEVVSFDQVGATEMRKKAGRHQTSPVVFTPLSRRWGVPETFDWGDIVDEADKVRMLTNPMSSYAMSARAALGRNWDQIIIDAFDAASFSGQRFSSTSVAFDSDNIIAVNFQQDGTTTVDTGLTIDKLRQTVFLLDAGRVPQRDRFFAYTAKQKQNLLSTTEVTDHDFAAVKALVEGHITRFLGMEFKMTELLPVASSIRDCFAYQKTGMGLVVATEMKRRFAERADLSFADYLYLEQDAGAVRVEESKVIKIKCNEA